MANVNVFSEIDGLREAIMHRPGRELVRMTPATREHFLFDDLLYTDYAQVEHDQFAAILGEHLGIKIHYFHDLLPQALAQAPASALDTLLARTALLEAEPQTIERRLSRLEQETVRQGSAPGKRHSETVRQGSAPGKR